MRRLGEEEKRKIRELQEKGISDAKISEMLGLSYSTVYKQRPEVKERGRQYMRQYYQRKKLENDPDLGELLNYIDGNGYLSENNAYVSLLEILCQGSKKFKQISRLVEEKMWKRRKRIQKGKLREMLEMLRNLGLVKYEDKRWSLSEEGRNLLKNLFEY